MARVRKPTAHGRNRQAAELVSKSAKFAIAVLFFGAVLITAANWTYPNTLPNHFALTAVTAGIFGFVIWGILYGQEHPNG